MAPPRGDAAASTFRRAVADVLVRRQEDKDCSPQPGINLCEKPGISSSTVTWIIIGTVIGVIVVVMLAVLLFLHFRRARRDKREDMNDRFQMSDYGLDELSSSKKPRADDDMRSYDGSPNGHGRRSREPLQVGSEPKYHGGQLNSHLSPFDDTGSVRSGNGSSYPPSVNPAWPKRDGSR
ncbi:hypothetical protein MMYC01_205396 [Madurella mycetomatis]|uniref:Uncharacterized protein n=1 Tax=Madurella mycetomatis TaxID=100816 RepID=A0A175W0E1_9PEZI|nr:hypothetical protein MMYC01_205396 [Madurella mycetomatis]